MIIIFGYKRIRMLQSLLSELEGNIVVIDDESEYDMDEIKGYSEYYRFPHQGKEGFYMLWNAALTICENSKDDWFLFLQDDVQDVQLEEIKRITSHLDYYGFNIMNRGPDRGWTRVETYPKEVASVDCEVVRYLDCVFCTNRKTLDKAGWQLDPVPMYRFTNPARSSGVGEQISKRFAKHGIPMIKPVKSLATHLDHPSLMHPEERKRNPLISK